MGTIECSQPASKSSWDSQGFGDISMVLKWSIFASPPGHDELSTTSCSFGQILGFYLRILSAWGLTKTLSQSRNESKFQNNFAIH